MWVSSCRGVVAQFVFEPPEHADGPCAGEGDHEQAGDGVGHRENRRAVPKVGLESSNGRAGHLPVGGRQYGRACCAGGPHRSPSQYRMAEPPAGSRYQPAGVKLRGCCPRFVLVNRSGTMSFYRRIAAGGMESLGR